ncbi:MAG: polymorphic toxin-type HINT domain-containing protein, partial [Alphaproteobacteria bacterium]|nr:polymorphic toxin-type HINT domain-containing protein [Alphaproteobacteria bacterium]
MVDYHKAHPIIVRKRLIDSTGSKLAIVEETFLDRFYRPERITRRDGAVEETTSFGYDPAGRANRARFERRDEFVDIRTTFDAHGRPVERSYDLSTAAGDFEGSMSLSWRANGQLEERTYPSGNRVTYTYDKVTGRLASIVAGTKPVFSAKNFDASGRPLLLELDRGSISIARSFDHAGRREQRQIRGMGPRLEKETFSYDTHGRLAGITSEMGGDRRETTYAYDTRNRLTRENHVPSSGSTRSFAYHYDQRTGLRVAKDDMEGAINTTTEYSYAPGNRLSAVGDAVVSWDGFGRQLDNAEGNHFAWGPANQLIAIESDGQPFESYMHDAAGLRVSRKGGALSELFLMGPGGELLQRRSREGKAFTDYIRRPNGAVVATIDHKGNLTPIVISATGSPYRIGSASANQVHRETSGFGEIIEQDGKLDEPLVFHQMLASGVDEILIAGLRPYDVATGRFLSPDPLGLGASSDPISSGDFFNYANDDPIAKGDPSGLSPCWQTVDGGCGTIPGEESYEQQRQAHMAHFAANDSETRALQEQANAYFETRASLTARAQQMAAEFAAEFPDGQIVESVRSTNARAPSEVESPTEPVNPPPTASVTLQQDLASSRVAGRGSAAPEIASGATAGSSSGGNDDYLEVVVYANPEKAERQRRGPRNNVFNRLGQKVFVDMLGLDRRFVENRQEAGWIKLENAVGDVVALPSAAAAVALCLGNVQCLKQVPAAVIQGAGQTVLDAAGTPLAAIDYIDAQLDSDATIDELVSADSNLQTGLLASEELMLAAVGAAAKGGKLGLGGRKCSFDGNTLVLTERGFVPIRDIVPGVHHVWSRNKESGEMAFKPVLDQYSNVYDGVVYVTVQNLANGVEHRILSNRVHPFFVTNDKNVHLVAGRGRENRDTPHPGSWVQAHNLRPGDRLLNADESQSRIVRVLLEKKRLIAYNLSVADFHTYFVKG